MRSFLFLSCLWYDFSGLCLCVWVPIHQMDHGLSLAVLRSCLTHNSLSLWSAVLLRRWLIGRVSPRGPALNTDPRPSLGRLVGAGDDLTPGLGK